MFILDGRSKKTVTIASGSITGKCHWGKCASDIGVAECVRFLGYSAEHETEDKKKPIECTIGFWVP